MHCVVCHIILLDLIPMEEEIDNWVNHDFWYTNQCIDHYDADIPLANVTDSTSGQLSKSLVTDMYCTPQPLSQPSLGSESVLKNLLVESGQNSQCQAIPALKVEVESPVSSMYMMPSEPSIFVPSPTIPIQSVTSDSGGM